MSTTTVRFVELMTQRFPPLKSILAEHLEDNFGETLPHVFMADVARWAIELFTTTKGKDLADERYSQLVGFLAFLEDAYEKAGPEIAELISVSFLEHLPRPKEKGWEIRSLVGPKLKKQLQVIG